MAFLAVAILASWGAAAARGPVHYSSQIGMTNVEFVASSRHVAVATSPIEYETPPPRQHPRARQYPGNSCTLCVRPEEIERLIVTLMRQRRLATPAAVFKPILYCDQRGRIANISTAWVGVTALILFVPSVAGLNRRRQLHRRRLANLCVKCGYDLRDNQSGRCPECGLPIPR